VEAKSEKGKQTDLQREWQELAESHGDIYILARSLDDVRKALE